MTLAGREGFEPSRELYTPYPLSRRVLSATQPPPRQRRFVRFYRPSRSPYLAPDGSTGWTRRAPDVGPWTQDGVRHGAHPSEQSLVLARRRRPQRSLLSLPRPRRAARTPILRLGGWRTAGGRFGRRPARHLLDKSRRPCFSRRDHPSRIPADQGVLLRP